jgi:hypothetical protein
MTFQDFKKLVKVQNIDDSLSFREEYIVNFIDVETKYYKKWIEVYRRFSDGYCYIGYLWDSLYRNQYKKITLSEILLFENTLKDVLVMWDVNSEENIYKKNYWNFFKRDVIVVEFSLLMSNLTYLPEDIYIFDKSFKWTIILTHEEVEGERYCFKVGDIPSEKNEVEKIVSK